MRKEHDRLHLSNQTKRKQTFSVRLTHFAGKAMRPYWTSLAMSLTLFTHPVDATSKGRRCSRKPSGLVLSCHSTNNAFQFFMMTIFACVIQITRALEKMIATIATKTKAKASLFTIFFRRFFPRRVCNIERPV